MAASSSIRQYRFPDLLPLDCALVLETTHALLTYLLADEIAAQRVLSRTELAVLLALLEAHPASCSDAVLYAAVTGVPAEEAVAFFQALALEWRGTALTPVREVLSRCRCQLVVCHLGIAPGEQGYRLFRLWGEEL